MRQVFGKSGVCGRRVGSLLVLAIIMVTIALPIGLRSAAAQDSSTIQTRVQFLHAGPNIGKLEIRLNGDKKVDGFEYGKTSDWIDIDPGAVELQMSEDRRGINYSIFDSVYPVPAGNDYYVVITDQIILGSVIDRSPIADGAARVRVVQGSIDLPKVNVVAKGSDVTFASQLSYPRSSDYISVPAGSSDIQVNLADSGQEALTVPGVNLEGNNVYDLVIMGDPSDSDHPLTISTLTDTTVSRAATPESTSTPAS
jgi:Domain of unknown function (DUF4397)